MSMDPLQQHSPNDRCACTKRHSPPVIEGNWHHIVPRAMGGPTNPGNLIYICPTTHTNVHQIMATFIHKDRVLPRRRSQPHYAHRLAALGFTRWKELPHVNASAQGHSAEDQDARGDD